MQTQIGQLQNEIKAQEGLIDQRIEENKAPLLEKIAALENQLKLQIQPLQPLLVLRNLMPVFPL